LNALLGLGTVLAPVFVAIFDGLGSWWGLPLLSAILLVGLIVESLRLPLQTETRRTAEARSRLVATTPDSAFSPSASPDSGARRCCRS
jgi:hypothetical protein